ncbi:hypothetical protein FPRO04_13213 [Fusarium proliferatum]|nr:hypothetical protein FPRO04_13213 [Fusarium proliferatum]
MIVLNDSLYSRRFGCLSIGHFGVGCVDIGIGRLGIGRLGIGRLGIGRLGIGRLGIVRLGIGSVAGTSTAFVLAVYSSFTERRLAAWLEEDLHRPTE